MKKYILALGIFTVLMASCREQKTETKEVIREVHVETETTEDREGVLERAAKEVDKEVNEEIDKTIEDIGNDD
ncbi:MAG: hypothetical protein CL526_03450 [Aequorivita sp.]|nr:hypothetical protein [Aequorivita sp.]|tara:strand:- start:2 stop:220 length:219 start_codon:yes stop_codon:yes gene_type:complete